MGREELHGRGGWTRARVFSQHDLVAGKHRAGNAPGCIHVWVCMHVPEKAEGAGVLSPWNWAYSGPLQKQQALLTISLVLKSNSLLL